MDGGSVTTTGAGPLARTRPTVGPPSGKPAPRLGAAAAYRKSMGSVPPPSTKPPAGKVSAAAAWRMQAGQQTGQQDGSSPNHALCSYCRRRTGKTGDVKKYFRPHLPAETKGDAQDKESKSYSRISEHESKHHNGDIKADQHEFESSSKPFNIDSDPKASKQSEPLDPLADPYGGNESRFFRQRLPATAVPKGKVQVSI